ncbi:hypothetical protein PHYBLDRAFT_145529 [Phycomyces blakesleeanus NRRL 1555(-)]|uniref:Uncharacterized protein n=1 Tax=Phycomyces blakesleeanus (strain ATCC 8743b / DSM 1359 / FGSC 10004 / NBRC 33097 / NRRL 1555) TaxID=763407 RepID=A0A162PUB8_PHYB8|nr:hypothetical protein PHYBLDRAFT_145529 [Phycomyces blakesleeanus NRRL 1555(-)]OAD74066.1 hypothetical protein PHYBLDRAFT_145529 [Phycomyces blakesleeanus NRRL 1555(-)]|eukprot:XP_018292106.1 hypothetical protein PHYBLDRAFT_145529 [Phycomyces blakesleeanus NRRL 1555(-)]
MIATTLSQYEYVLICDKSNIRVSGSSHQVVYNDRRISSCKNDMTSSAFVNNQIKVIKSIEILGQVYKGCNDNGRDFYIQALFKENRMNAYYGYVGEIQYIFVYSFTPTNSPTTLYNHNHQHTFAFVKWYKTTSDILHRILLPVAIVDYKTTRNVNKKMAIPLPQKIYA